MDTRWVRRVTVNGKILTGSKSKSRQQDDEPWIDAHTEIDNNDNEVYSEWPAPQEIKVRGNWSVERGGNI